MLYIEFTERKTGIKRQFSWHIGERLPRVNASVVTFQADGDELSKVMDALIRIPRSN